MSRTTRLACTLSALTLLASCGGGGVTPPPPPPGPDFSVTVSPVSASAVLGNPTSAVMISVAPEHGFNASVDMSLQGLPQGVDAAPPSFSLTPGASQSITFAVSPSAAVGVFPITVLGSSGSLSHSTSMTLNTEPVVSVRTFQSGSLLYLESSSGADVSRVGMQTVWGGSIVEVSVNGENFVNAHDAGREVQLAQFDHDNLDWSEFSSQWVGRRPMSNSVENPLLDLDSSHGCNLGNRCDSDLVAELAEGSGQHLGTLAKGETDPEKLAQPGDERLQCTEEQLVDALTGRAQPVHGEMLALQLERLQLIDQQMARLNSMIAEALKPHQDAVIRLAEVPGLGVDSAQQIIAEVGAQASTFQSAAELTSWVGTCPGKEESAEQNRSSRSAKGNKYLRRVLNQAAHAAVAKKGSHFQVAPKQKIGKDANRHDCEVDVDFALKSHVSAQS